MNKKLIAIALLALTTHAYALSAAPKASDEKRIITEFYTDSKIYKVCTKVGIATLIQLEEGETLVDSKNSLLGMGDASAWDLGVRENNITLKPKKLMPNTNIVMVTNKRTYAFDLINNNKSINPTYIFRFVYPRDYKTSVKTSKEILADKEIARISALSKNQKYSLNTNYTWVGVNQLLKPNMAWDDGKFTYFKYDNAGELPIFYKVLPDNTEAQLNYSISNNDKAVVEVHELVRNVKARINNEVIEIHNNKYKMPPVNYKGTTNDTIRMDK